MNVAALPASIHNIPAGKQHSPLSCPGNLFPGADLTMAGREGIRAQRFQALLTMEMFNSNAGKIWDNSSSVISLASVLAAHI